jgi:hypothetical protein
MTVVAQTAMTVLWLAAILGALAFLLAAAFVNKR